MNFDVIINILSMVPHSWKCILAAATQSSRWPPLGSLAPPGGQTPWTVGEGASPGPSAVTLASGLGENTVYIIDTRLLVDLCVWHGYIPLYISRIFQWKFWYSKCSLVPRPPPFLFLLLLLLLFFGLCSAKYTEAKEWQKKMGKAWKHLSCEWCLVDVSYVGGHREGGVHIQITY